MKAFTKFMLAIVALVIFGVFPVIIECMFFQKYLGSNYIMLAIAINAAILCALMYYILDYMFGISDKLNKR